MSVNLPSWVTDGTPKTVTLSCGSPELARTDPLSGQEVQLERRCERAVKGMREVILQSILARVIGRDRKGTLVCEPLAFSELGP